MKAVDETGCGLVPPDQADMRLEKPTLARQGSRYGVQLKATAPSLHLMKVDIGTQVCPVVGSQKQTEDLVAQLSAQYDEDPDSLWETNLFGKTLGELVRDGLSAKLARMPADTPLKMQEAMGKIINEGSGGMICILL